VLPALFLAPTNAISQINPTIKERVNSGQYGTNEQDVAIASKRKNNSSLNWSWIVQPMHAPEVVLRMATGPSTSIDEPKMETAMKTPLFLAVLTFGQFAVSTAAFAQQEEFLPNGHGSNLGTNALSREMPSDARGAVTGSPHIRAPRQAAPSQDVVTSPDGTVIGQDPDPNVRFEMRRDWNEYEKR
jgi:hypothetical protein